MLTAGTDNFVGGASNDVFNANLALNPSTGSANVQTLTAFDSLDGAGGNNTLNVQYGADVSAVPTNSVKNIQTVNIQATGQVEHNLTQWTGLNTLNVQTTDATKTLGFVTKGAESVTTKGGLTVGITDGSAAGTVAVPTAVNATTGSDLKSVAIDSAAGAVAVAANGLTSLTLSNLTTNVNATVFAKAGARELTLNLDSVAGTRTVTDGEATTLKVVATGKHSEGLTLTAGKATSVVIDNSAAAKSSTDKSGLTIANVNIGAAKSLVATGSSLTTITATAGVGVLETISSVDSTGGLAIGAALATGVVFTGGAGNDSITLGAATKVNTMGAGDDKVTLSGAALGVGGSVDAGEGRDTLSMTAANAVTATATNNVTNFTGKVKGFEVLEISNTVAVDSTISLANLNTAGNNVVDTIVFAAGHTITGPATATIVTVAGAVSGATVQFKAGNAASTSTVVNVSGADTGVNDVLNIGISSNTTGIDVKAVTANDVETVNFLTDDSAATATGIQHIATLNGDFAKSITVSGDAGINLTAASTALTSFDASGVTKGAVTWTAGALTNAATVVAGQDGSTINLAAATKAVTFTGGAKVDTVTSGKGADIFTLGAGNDIINYTNANQSGITIATADKVLDWGVGVDVLNFAGSSTATAVTAQATVQAAVDAVAGSGFATVLNEASTAIGANKVGAFQFEGNTYVFANDASTAVATTDLLIQLVGEHTLTAANFAFV